MTRLQKQLLVRIAEGNKPFFPMSLTAKDLLDWGQAVKFLKKNKFLTESGRFLSPSGKEKYEALLKKMPRDKAQLSAAK